MKIARLTQCVLTRVIMAIFLGVSGFGAWSDCYAASWVAAKVAPAGTGRVYLEPKAGAKLLGVYPKGTPVRVYDQAKNGFYAIYLKAEWQGTHYIWISTQDVELTGSAGESPAGSSQRGISSARSESQVSRAKSAWSVEPRLGYSSFNYSQTNLSPGNQITALAGQLAVTWRLLPSSLVVMGDVNMTLSALSHSRAESLSFIRSTLKGGLSFDTGSMQWFLGAGAYLTTMSGAGGLYGYGSWWSSGVFPQVTFRLGKDVDLMGWLDYVPDFTNSFQTADLTYGVGLAYWVGPTQRLTAYFRSTTLQLGNLATTGIKNQSSSFEVGYQF